MQRTKIVATVGPATRNPQILKTMIVEGVDIFRINASHTTPKTLADWIRFIRSTAAKAHKPVAILVDLQGPRVRTGSLKDGKPLDLKRGAYVTIWIGNKAGFGNEFSTSCRPFLRMVKRGDPILLDNGLIELRVLKVHTAKVLCRVHAGGKLGENKGINLPHAPITLPALTPKDIKDLRVAAAMNVDYVALSFVRSEKDIHVIKQWLNRKKKSIPVIAKIEKARALKRLPAILNTADGVMVARGDLGIEVGVEKVPLIQKRLIERANELKKPVITATQMLESMITQTHPTRAEASDIANAVFDGTDAVMLSGETAVGHDPAACVRIMEKIIREAERYNERHPEKPFFRIDEASIQAVTHSAAHMAKEFSAHAILVFTHSGKTAAYVSKQRPPAKVIAVVPQSKIGRYLALFYGLSMVEVPYRKDMDHMIRAASHAVLKARMLQKGNRIVIVSGKHAFPAGRYMIKLHTL